MPLADGYSDVPRNKLANVATFLEMRERPRTRPDSPGIAASLRRKTDTDVPSYRSLFRSVGEPYLWSSRLVMADDELLEILRDERVEVYTVDLHGRAAGFLELDFRPPRECELAFFGLTDDALGRGVGRWLMNRAIERAWSAPIERFFVHTCTLDHPNALGFYIRSGFTPYKRQIEIYDDPRIMGVLSPSSAPQVPML
jgi:GNAT superfamily N-acetyltransferase